MKFDVTLKGKKGKEVEIKGTITRKDKNKLKDKVQDFDDIMKRVRV